MSPPLFVLNSTSNGFCKNVHARSNSGRASGALHFFADQNPGLLDHVIAYDERASTSDPVEEQMRRKDKRTGTRCDFAVRS